MCRFSKGATPDNEEALTAAECRLEIMRFLVGAENEKALWITAQASTRGF